MNKIRALAAILPAIILSTAGLANMGGNSSGNFPSQSGPRYDPAAEYRKGVEAFKAENYEDAETAFSRVTKVAPKEPNSWMLLGMSRARQNNFDGAETALKRAVDLDSKNILAHQELALTYAKNHKPNEARAEADALKARLDACAEPCDEGAQLRNALSTITAAIGGASPSSWQGLPERFFGAPEAGDRVYLQAVSLINERKYAGAVAQLQTARDRFGPHPDILTALGDVSRKMGRPDLAEDYYRQALAVDPVHRGTLEYYGELKVQRGDLRGAKLMLAKLERECNFGCPEARDLRRWIEEPAVRDN